MSFRLRVTLLAAGAVAVAVIGAALLMFLVLQQQLLAQVDKSLADAATTAQAQGPRGNDRGGRPPFGDPGQTVSGLGDVFAQSIDALRPRDPRRLLATGTGARDGGSEAGRRGTGADDL